jgi:superfamily II DNA/RNA helicase
MPATFSELNLLDSLQRTLAEQELVHLTPIQRLALPEMLARRSVVAVAETGSGKTISYVLPILDRLRRMEEDDNPVVLESEPRALVIVPSRELADQVARVFKVFTHHTRVRVRRVFGGQKMRKSRDAVAGVFEVLVSTPGRLVQLLDRGSLRLDGVRFVVLDEADQLLDLGFLKQVMGVVGAVQSRRQLGTFSATMSPQLEELARDLFPDAIHLRTERVSQLPATLVTRHVDVPDGRRVDALRPLLAEPTEGGTILFANTRAQCDRIVSWVREAGLPCEGIRSDMDPVARRRHLRAFRAGELPFLVSTDVAGRGLDVDHVGRVINVHLPREMDNYVHRAGRTARAGRDGLLINLVTPRDAPLLEALDDGHVAPAFQRPPTR